MHRRAHPGETNIREILDGLRQIVRVLRLSAREAEKRRGLSGAQLFVLQRLAENPSSTINDLAARTFTHQSSVSVVVKRLADRKLVRRENCSEDGRRSLVSLTAAGRRLLRNAPETAQEHLIESIERLSPAKRRSLARGLAELVAQMGVGPHAPELFFEEPVPAGPKRRRSRVRPPSR